MPKQLPSINVVPRVPLWLESSEEELDITIPLFSSAYQSLLQTSRRDEPEFYSNQILAERVNKINTCKNLLLTLQTEEKDFEARKKTYRKSYDEERFQFMQKTAELSDHRQRLVLQLQLWQQNALIRFQEAQTKFNEIQNKAAKMKIKMNKQTIAEGYNCFVNKYGDVASFIYDEDNNIIDIMGVERLYRDLPKESSAELKHIAKLIKDAALIKLAEEFMDEEVATQKKFHDYFDSVPTWLKPIDMSASTAMVKQANQLSREYHLAAEQLSKESHLFYQALDKRERELRIKMLTTNKAIRRARSKFEEFYDCIINPTVNDCRIIISVYEEYEKTVETAANEYEKFESQFLSVKAEYRQAGEKFGVYRERVVDHLEYGVKDRLGRNVTKADATRLYYTSEIDEYKVRIAQEDLLVLIKNAIANNLKFWHKQTGLFGSSTKIGKISVPRGIAQIHNKDCQGNKTTKETLLAIKNTIGDRITYGAGSWYARRNLSTTDYVYEKLYKLLNKMDLLSSDDVKELKDILTNMGLVEIESPVIVNYRHDKTELSHRHAGQEITMKESDFLASDKPI